MAWKCTCKLVNSALNVKCWCGLDRPEDYNTDSTEQWVNQNRFNLEVTTMSESNEELYKRFYARDRVLVKGKGDNELTLWQDELAAIATEVKAGWNAAEDEKRERKAKNSVGKQWLLSNERPEPELQGRITKAKSERVNKADKLRQDMLKYMDEDAVNALMKKVVINGKTASRNVNNSDITFRKHQEAIAEAEEDDRQRSQNEHKEPLKVIENPNDKLTEEPKLFNNPFKK